MDMDKTEMPSKEVIFLYQSLEQMNIPIWIDGGWGVDALLEIQTRPHQDLDIVIQKKHLTGFLHLLTQQGYQLSHNLEDTWWNFVLDHSKRYKVDVHVILFNNLGDGLYGPLEKGLMYPAASLQGIGKIDNQPVRCITPEYMVKFHTGYPLREQDLKDVTALCKKFNLKCPKEYDSFKTP